MGVVSLLSERSARSQTSPGRVSERRTWPLWDLGRGCSRRTQRAFGTAMRLCVSLFRGVAAPLGCVICLQLGDVAVFSLCAQYFLNVRGGGGITTLGAFHTFRKPCVAGAQNSKLCRFLRSDGRSSPHDSYFLANTQNFLLAVPVANTFALWYDKFDKLELSN